ncbi:alpha/beta hydrolase family protein [Paenibacillus sp. FSL R5-0623]|uniref:alpha/beta hydrolase n=2 Tax=Paenibacillus TaxID=44249 RepID=UPI0003E1F6E8|nr:MULTISPECIES: alpha/beta hydrolase family protein [Paenibacillus]ETT36678.1 esterase [Paenibacillus sp. FSL R5-192]KLU53644.1 esterase [Paenibacillus sp. VT-400]OMF43113.1 esterase [Paenibacillus amylolyticus]PKQ92682.1 esterase [Paenibacillus sp. BGI2013]
MAHITIETGSPTLCMNTSIHVVSSDSGETSGGTLYLLHGAGDNASTWQRLTTIEMYAAQYGCTIIMPEANRSYYTDMEYGLNYFHYITQELPEICKRLLNLNPDPEKTYVAGLSMGGYGALKCGLTYPERYRKVVSLSGVTDIQTRLHDPHMPATMIKEMKAVFGERLQVKADQDIYALSAKLLEQGVPLPDILSCCGDSDPFVEMNRDYARYMQGTAFDFRYVETPGAHEWRFWEHHLRTMFDFLYNDKTIVE